MSNLTAIELGSRSVSAVQARANGQGLQVVKAATAAIATVDADSLRGALKECGVDGGRAILLVQRGQALLRDLELPAGTPDELVSMVRFQVEREMPLPLDQIRYSYIETDRSGGKVRVQVVAVPREVIDPAIAAFEAAGVKISNVYVSSFGLLSLYANGEPAALVEVAGGETEILVVDHGRMEFCRTAPLVEGLETDRVAEEVERTLLAYAARSPGKDVRKVVLAGEGAVASELAQALRAKLSREVTQVGPGDLETAAAAGICLGVALGRPLPDLLNPPAAAKGFRFTRVHRIAAIAAAVVLGFVLWSQIALSNRKGELRRKQEELARLQPKAKQVTTMEDWTALAQKWYRERNEYFDILVALRKNVDRSKLWIVSSAFDDTGLAHIQGKARDNKNVTDFVAALDKQPIFQSVKIEKMNANTEKGEYRTDFSLTAYLKGYDAKKKRP